MDITNTSKYCKNMCGNIKQMIKTFLGSDNEMGQNPMKRYQWIKDSKYKLLYFLKIDHNI